jgi:hypothetical protein
MIKILLVGVMFYGSIAFSDSKEIVMPSKCVISANHMLIDFGMGSSPENPPSVYLDPSGKTVIANQDNIVKRKIENGVETITYKVKQPNFRGYKSGQPIQYEVVERTVTIRRDKSGRLIGASKLVDLEPQIQMSKEAASNGGSKFPILKSFDNEYTYRDGDCAVDQSLGLEMESADSKVEKKVYYDKQYCDTLAPTLKQMGTQNAAMCGNLINQAQAAFDARNKGLKKENKSFKMFNYFGQTPDPESNYSTTFNISMAIQSCTMADSILWGGGFGMGFPGGSGGLGTGTLPPSKHKAKPAKATQ